MAAQKVLVATGCSSALGFHAVRQLLANPSAPRYKAILGCRDTAAAKKAYDGTEYDKSKHELVFLDLELADLKNVKSFAQETQSHLNGSGIDTLFLNAGLTKAADQAFGRFGKWNETAVVNHFAQHYLVHLLRNDMRDNGRIVFVSSGAIRMVKSIDTLEDTLADQSNANTMQIYAASKFAQLLNAIWWRRQLQGKTSVVAVSPGLIPGTGLGRHTKMEIPANLPDAKSVDEGARSLLAAFDKSGQPDNPNAVYLASWGEWWDPKEHFPLAVDEALQEKWSPSLQDIEREARR